MTYVPLIAKGIFGVFMPRVHSALVSRVTLAGTGTAHEKYFLRHEGQALAYAFSFELVGVVFTSASQIGVGSNHLATVYI